MLLSCGMQCICCNGAFLQHTPSTDNGFPRLSRYIYLFYDICEATLWISQVTTYDRHTELVYMLESPHLQSRTSHFPLQRQWRCVRYGWSAQAIEPYMTVNALHEQ